MSENTTESIASAPVVNLDKVTVTGVFQTFKVMITGPGGRVIVQASPTLNETRTANYEGYNITHLPTDMYAYRNTSGRKFSIQAKLVSRNVLEAQGNAKYLDLIRTWVLPDFGNSGATPPIVKLSAFNNNNISRVTCVLKSYGFTFPDDVDFIYDAVPPMPVIATLGIELDEIYSAEGITNLLWTLNNKRAPGRFEGDGSPSGGSSIDGIATSTNFGSVGNLLDTVKGISANPISSISSIASSPSLTDNLKAAIPNNFVSGISQAAISSAINPILQVAQQQVKNAADSFGRSIPLVPPSITKFF